MILTLAIRNVWRNGRRTALTVAGIGIALALMFTSMAMQNGAWNMMITAAIQATAGHVVVQADGWQEERDPNLVLQRSTEVQQALLEAYPDAVVVRRVFLGGLLSSPTGSQAVAVQGVEPVREAELTLLDDQLVDGTWLPDDRAIVVGQRLAEILAVELGDKVVLMAQVGTEELESRLFRVRGTFRTGNDTLDAFAAFVPLAAAQELMPFDDPAHQVAVVLPSIGRGKLDTSRAAQALAGRDGLEVLSWSEALPMLEEQQRVDTQMNVYIFVLMGLIVAIGVTNTVLMSVMERIREFGVLLSIGMRPRMLAGMIVLETLVLGSVGAVVGLLLSIWPIGYLTTHGIDYGDLMANNSAGGNVPIDSVLRAHADVPQMLQLAVVGALVAVLAALYPARKATRLTPVEAMHHH
ncbi:MAG: ABC transporter permease [Alphaproteobacteria bacterium]|nr:ABC transporter permease [Alphaproteobacteria bacterium]